MHLDIHKHRIGIEAPRSFVESNVIAIFEAVMICMVFFHAMHGFLPLYAGQLTNKSTDTTTARLLISLIPYSIALAVLVLRYSSDFIALIRQNLPLVMLLILALASCLWSDLPWVSLRRALAVNLTAVFAAYLVIRFSDERILRLLGCVALFFVLSSVAYILVYPDDGTVTSAYKNARWAGYVGGNTFFGRCVAISVIVFWLLRGTDGWRVISPLAVAFGLFVLAMSGAMTAILGVLAVAIVIVLGGLRPRFSFGVRLLFIIVLVAPVISFALFDFDQFVGFLGRDPTLTTRTRIWDLAISLGPERTFFGVGFRVFWTEQISIDLQAALFGSYLMKIEHGHSGYLDLWLELGFVGVLLYLILIISVGGRCFRILQHRKSELEMFAPLVFVFLLFYSITENAILGHSEIVWLVFMLGVLTSSRASGPAPRR